MAGVKEETIKRNICKFLKDKHLNQNELMSVWNESESNISKILHSSAPLSADHIWEFCEKYGVSLETLFEDNVKEPKPLSGSQEQTIDYIIDELAIEIVKDTNDHKNLISFTEALAKLMKRVSELSSK